MTAPADRCGKCDRAECDKAAAEAELQDIRKRYASAPRAEWLEASQAALGRLRRSGCKPVDWRAEALASRALLREVVYASGIWQNEAAVAARIREHLAGRP